MTVKYCEWLFLACPIRRLFLLSIPANIPDLQKIISAAGV
jgi:hypothetical protein